VTVLIDVSADFNLPFQVAVAGIVREATNPPTFVVIGPSGVTAGGGTASFMQSGAVTGATNANPIVVTSNGHGLQNGQVVTISGVLGNTNANTTARVANKAANTFELNGVAGNAAYISGGTWRPTGLYKLPFDSTLRAGLEAGKTYQVVVYWTYSGQDYSGSFTFTVV
jgi:hypothetical protein